jgi:hypothetical protein
MKADKSAEDYLAQIAKDMAVTRDLISKYVNAHTDGNVFEQVRRKMTDDPNNRWDHTRAIGGPK